MVIKRNISSDGKICTAVISNEPKTFLAAKAAKRAVIGVEREGEGIQGIKGIPCVIPDIEDATDELLGLVIHRHLGFLWNIYRTLGLLIRKLTADDAGYIPGGKYGPQEVIFRLGGTLELYRRSQYGSYEYGTWALIRREDQVLVGLVGMSSPRLTGEMEDCLDSLEQSAPWLELGYHIFLPYRQPGHCAEAVSAVTDYSYEALQMRFCAPIHRENQAFHRVAEDLGVMRLMETDIQSFEGQFLYGEGPV